MSIRKTAAYFTAFTLIVAGSLSGLTFHFYQRSLKTDSEYKNLVKKSGRDFAELQKKYDKLQKDFEGLVKERDNLLIQIKGFVYERAKLKELEGVTEQNKQDIAAMTKETQSLREQNLALKSNLRNLELQVERLTAEKKTLAEELLRERDVSILKKTEKEKADLQKENAGLLNDLKLSQAKVRELEGKNSKQSREFERLKLETQDLQGKVDTLNKQYAEALQKNNKLQRQITEEPKKLVELARQNQMLLKRTANLYYNVGVFYMQQKEYARASREFEKAVELDPDDAYAHFNLGYIYAEHLVDRKKAIAQLRDFLRLAKKDDKDVDWAKNYLLTWESWGGKKPME
jgi:tetratricopeptide (TPR) repeat protein